jgi:hypothetical protein
MNKNIYIDQGASFSTSITTGIDLTGYTLSAQIRKWYDENRYEFMDVVITTTNTGIITLSMKPADTAKLKPGRMVYDVLGTLGSGTRQRILEGQAIVTPGLTSINPPDPLTTIDTETLIITQGSTFTHVIELRDENGVLKNLTGYTAEMQIRPNAESSIVIMDLTDANSRLVITPLIGQIEISLSSTETAGFTFDTAVYDLEITAPDTTVTRVIGGNISLIPNITK